jgi:macrolide transport system ATP-binding/permease protein
MHAFLMRTMARIHNLFRSRRADAELEREIAAHVVLLEEEYERRGMLKAEARAAARRRLGGVEQVKQSHRDQRSIPWLEQTRQDMRHAGRTFARNPGFTLVAVVTLAAGIGVNTTLFTAYDAVALKPLPVADASRVVRLERWFVHGWLGDIQYAFSWPEFVYCREHQSVFSNLVASSSPVKVPAILPGDTEETQPAALQGQLVSGNYFRSFEVNAMLGRTFGPDEDRVAGANPVMVLSYAYWQRAFHGDPGVLGAMVKLNGRPFSVIGIAPQEFTGTELLPQVPDFWAPASMQAQLVPGQDWLGRPADYRFQILGRLKPDIGLGQAQTETAALVRQFSRTYFTREPTSAVTLQHTAFFGNTEDPRFQAGVAALMLIVAMVLFVACANVANMLLARGATRQREISLRLALGASRARVMRQLITESVLLSLAGGVAGLALSILAGRLLTIAVAQMLSAQLGSDFAFSLNLSPDAHVLMYALALSLIAGVVFGLSPALQFSKPELARSLRDESTSFGHRMRRSHLRSLLIGGQVAVSMLLLSCSGLLVRALMKSQDAEPGFDTRKIFLLLGDYGDTGAKTAPGGMEDGQGGRCQPAARALAVEPGDDADSSAENPGPGDGDFRRRPDAAGGAHGRRRHLRRDGLRGEPENAGDRHPDGVGRAFGTRAAEHMFLGTETGCRRHAGRTRLRRCGVGCVAQHAFVAISRRFSLRRALLRSLDVRRHHELPGRCFRAGLPGPGPESGEGGSVRRAALRVAGKGG